MIGYKATDKDGYCRGFKFEVGKTYIKDTPKKNLNVVLIRFFTFVESFFAIEKRK